MEDGDERIERLAVGGLDLDRAHDIHALDHLAERREALAVGIPRLQRLREKEIQLASAEYSAPYAELPYGPTHLGSHLLASISAHRRFLPCSS